MKVIKGINEKLKIFSLETEEDDKSSFSDMFRTTVALSVGRSPDQTLELLELGLKIKGNHSDNLSLEESDFKLLKEKVEANILQQASFFHGQLLKKLKEAENESSKKS